MGGQLSANYTDIKPLRNEGCFKVHSAVHKTTNERVSLWILDQELLNNEFQDKDKKNAYIDQQIASAQFMRKMRHPHILKIFDIVEKKPEFAFSTEPIDDIKSLYCEGMHNLDATYICLQIAETLSFINEEAHYLYLGLSAKNVYVDSELSIKLKGFEFASQLTGGSIMPNPLLTSSIRFADNSNRPPEFLSNRELSDKSDVYQFGLILYNCLTGKQLYGNNEPKRIYDSLPTVINSINGVTPEFRNLIQRCLAVNPVNRPPFSRVLDDASFNTLQMKSLKYIDLILTKQAPDKFKFYKGLASKIDQFSPTLLRIKILPRLLEECKADVRFAPILLPSIFMISHEYDNDDFVNTVWNRISFLTGVTDPPEVAIALLKNMWLLLKKLDIRLHKDYVYPIFFTALQSTSPKVHSECLEKIDLILKEMNENAVRSSLVPRLMELVSNSPEPAVSTSALRCVAHCLDKVDNESFIVDFFQRIVDAWQKRSSEGLATAIIEVCEPLRAAPDTQMARVVPLLATVAGSHTCGEALKNRYCNLIIKVAKALEDYKEAAAPVAAPSSPQQPKPKTTSRSASMLDADNPFDSPEPPKPQPKPAVNLNINADDIFGDSRPKPTPKPAFSSASAGGDDFGLGFGKPLQKPTSTTSAASTSTSFGDDLLGPPKPAKVSARAAFGGTASTGGGFGNDILDLTAPTTSSNSGFVSSGFGANSGFGGSSASSGFGSSNQDSGFGGSSGFGNSNKDSGFGGSSGFGNSNSGFGNSGSGFGGGAGNSFGGSSGFGGNTGGGFGGGSGFGSNGGFSSPSGFGGNTSTGFGGSGFGNDSGFGNSNSGFGNSNTGFGNSNAGFGNTGGFGAPQGQGFGQQNQGQGFGGFGANSGFGQNQSGFGQQNQGGFGF